MFNKPLYRSPSTAEADSEQSLSVNNLPCIVKLNRRIAKLSGARGDYEGEEEY